MTYSIALLPFGCTFAKEFFGLNPAQETQLNLEMFLNVTVLLECIVILSLFLLFVVDDVVDDDDDDVDDGDDDDVVDDDDAHVTCSAQLSGLGTYCEAGEGTSPDGCRCSHCSQGGLH